MRCGLTHVRNDRFDDDVGILGCILSVDGTDAGTCYLLTCAHVLAPVARGAQEGDTVMARVGDGSKWRAIGVLRMKTTIDDAIDVAIAELTTPIEMEIADISVVGYRFRVADAGEALRFVTKAGTIGVLTVHAGNVPETYTFDFAKPPPPHSKQWTQTNLIACGPSVPRGTSGSVAVDNDGLIVGMISGSTSAKTMVTPMWFILAEIERQAGLTLRPAVNRAVPGIATTPGAFAQSQVVETLAWTLWGVAEDQVTAHDWTSYEAVAEVVVNVVNGPGSPRSIESACRDPAIFSCWQEGNRRRVDLEQPQHRSTWQFEAARAVAARVVAGARTSHIGDADRFIDVRQARVGWRFGADFAHGKRRIGDLAFYQAPPTPAIVAAPRAPVTHF